MSTNDNTNMCAICAETYSSRRKMITCLSCEKSACSQCCENFIMHSGEAAKCMYPDCGEAWSRKFMVENFTQTYVSKRYMKHLENVYYDKVRSLLPATQELADREIVNERTGAIHKEYNKKISELRRQLVSERHAILSGVLERLPNEGLILVHNKHGEINNNAMSVGNLWTGGGKYGDDVECAKHPLDNTMAFYLSRAFANSGTKYGVIRHLIRTRHAMPTDFLYLAAELMKNKTATLYVPWTTTWINYHRKHYSHVADRLNGEIQKLTEERFRKLEAIPGWNRTANKEKQEVRFVRGCPKEDCRGFLSTAWKCGMCDVHVCSKCHLPNDDGEDHVCNESDVATAKMISAESKPCPNCHVNITKIDGCNQMWCTQCKTAWNWVSGRIETHVHNPHYFEYMRNRQTTERNPNEVRCGREVDAYMLEDIKRKIIEIGRTVGQHSDQPRGLNLNKEYAELSGYERYSKIHRAMLHITHNDIDANLGNEPDTTKIRIAYLRQKISLDAFKRRIRIAFQGHMRKVEIRDLLSMFRQVCTEILYRYKDAVEKSSDIMDLISATKILDEIHELEKYVNQQLLAISKTYRTTQMWLACNPIKHKNSGINYELVGLHNPVGYITYDLTN